MAVLADRASITADATGLDRSVVQSRLPFIVNCLYGETMLELNALTARIKDMRARLADLRGYL